MHMAQQAASPGSAAADGRAGSPTGELRDLQNMMLTRQLAELQKRCKEVEAENLRLKEQVRVRGLWGPLGGAAGPGRLLELCGLR
jgi:transcription initiation factor TFIID subunit TAF12